MELTPEQAHAISELLEARPPEGDDRLSRQGDAAPNIPGFRIIRKVASGGMGDVYEAEQAQPRRRVALKVLRPELCSRSALRRFEFEAQVLAQLRHPGIAQVFEAGTYDDGGGGVPYFAMEYVAGARPLTEYADAEGLDLKKRLELFAKVCDAIHHGHQKGIVHRDLKPSNILVDPEGSPKVIDFGVARGTDSDLAVTTQQTDLGRLIGTLRYMSPEQCAGDPHDIDTRSDVYALGVVLYELLCGRLPYDVDRKATHEVVRTIREDLPMRPSAVSRILRGDVETIALKALEKDRARRYQSAGELGQDIGRYLQSEPIAARPPSLWYQLSRMARRHRAAATAVASVFAMLCISVVALAVFWSMAAQALKSERSADARRRGMVMTAAAEAVASHRIGTASSLLEAVGAIETSSPWELRHLRSRLDDSLASTPVPDCRDVAFVPGRPIVAVASTEGLFLLRYDPERPTLLSRIGEPVTGDEGVGAFYLVCASPDGRTVMAIGRGTGSKAEWNQLVAWNIDDPTTPRRIGSWPAAEFAQEAVMGIGFDPRGASVFATVSTGERPARPRLRLWRLNEEVERPVESASIDLPAGGWGMAFSPDGTRIAIAGEDRVGRIYAVEEPGTRLRLVAELRGHWSYLQGCAFNLDGSLVATCSADGTTRVWDVPASEAEFALRRREGGQGDAVGVALTTLAGHNAPVLGVAFSPRRLELATVGFDSTLRTWRPSPVETAGAWPQADKAVAATAAARFLRETAVLHGGADGDRGKRSVCYSCDGGLLATASQEGSVRLWSEADRGGVPRLFGHGSSVFGVAVLPGSKTAVSVGGETPGRLLVWDLDGLGEARGRMESATSRRYRAVAAHPSKALVLATVDIGLDGENRGGAILVDCTDPAHPQPLEWLVRDGPILAGAAFSPDGRWAAVAGECGTLRVWRIDTNGRFAEADLANSEFAEATFAAVEFDRSGGQVMAVGEMGEAGVVTLVDLAIGRPLRSQRVLTADVGLASAAADPRADRLAVGGSDGTVRVLDTRTWKELVRLSGHVDEVGAVAFLPDGSRLASAGRDRRVLLWDTENWTQAAELRDQRQMGTQTCLAFAPDGRRLLSGSMGGFGADNVVRVWEVGVPEPTRWRRVQSAHSRP